MTSLAVSNTTKPKSTASYTKAALCTLLLIAFMAKPSRGQSITPLENKGIIFTESQTKAALKDHYDLIICTQVCQQKDSIITINNLAINRLSVEVIKGRFYKKKLLIKTIQFWVISALAIYLAATK
jgi:hypothetical protein